MKQDVSAPTEIRTLSVRALFKDILHGSGLYSITVFGPVAASLILMPITTRYLTRADYSITDLLERVSIVVALLLGVNFSAALGYFYLREDRRRVVTTTVLGATALGIGAALISVPFAGGVSRLVFPNASAAPYLVLVFATIPVGFLLEALFAWLRVENRPGIFTLAALLRVGLTVAGIGALVGVLKLHVWGVLYTSVIAQLATVLYLLVYGARRGRLSLGVRKFDARLFGRMAKFALYLGFGGLAMFIIHFGDRFILPHYRSFDELGIYSLAYKIGMLLSAAYASFNTYWSAQVFQVMQREDSEEMFSRIFTYVFLGLSFGALGLLVCARPALRIMAAPAFQGAAALVPVIVLAYYIRCIGDFLRCLFLAAGRPAYDAACNWLGALVCLGGYFGLIPKFGMWGAAFATVGAFTFIGIVAAVWTYRLKPYRVEGGRIAKVATALAASALIYAIVPAHSLAAEAGLAALAMAVFPATLWLLRLPTAGELETSREAIRRIRERFRAPAVECAASDPV